MLTLCIPQSITETPHENIKLPLKTYFESYYTTISARALVKKHTQIFFRKNTWISFQANAEESRNIVPSMLSDLLKKRKYVVTRL